MAMLGEENIRKAYKMGERCSPLWKPTDEVRKGALETVS